VADADGPDVLAGHPAPLPDEWLRVRRVLREQRMELGRAAARLYAGLPRAAGTGLLARPEWLPGSPIGLDELPLTWRDDPPAPVIDPAGPLTRHVRPRLPGPPLTGAGPGRRPPAAACGGVAPGGGQPGAGLAGDGRYPTYAEAVGALDRPALFENRVCYRLLDARLSGRPELAFAACRYFDGMNLGHAAAHELAAAWAADPGGLTAGGLPLRAAAGDPCDLARRCATVAVATLTLRRGPGDQASFVLHWRDPARVNHAGGLYQVLPAGMFQPVTDAPAALPGDLSLWRCMVREFSEELLGTAEDYATSGGVLDYESWPLHRRLAAARAAGTLGVWCVGAGVDPLTLATDILTVAVFDAGVFDSVFGGLVAANAEGRVVMTDGSAAIPFTAQTVRRFSDGTEPVQAAGAALLRLAWQHRRHLLG
jgi:hypothetical protein